MAPAVVFRSERTHSSPASTLSTIGSLLRREGRTPAVPPAATGLSACTMDSAPVVRFITTPTAVALTITSRREFFGGNRNCHVARGRGVPPAGMLVLKLNCGIRHLMVGVYTGWR